MQNRKAKKTKKELLQDLAELPENKDEFARISAERMEEIKKDPQSIENEEINTLSLFSSLLRLENTDIIEEQLKKNEMNEKDIRKRFEKDLPKDTEELMEGNPEDMKGLKENTGKEFMEKSGGRALDIIGYLMHTKGSKKAKERREKVKKEIDRIEKIIKGSPEVEDSLIKTDIFMQGLGTEKNEPKKGLEEKEEKFEA